MIRNTEELDGIGQSVERIEENLATSVEADQVPLPSQEDIVHPAPGRVLTVQHFLDGFRQLVGLERAKQHLKFAKSLSDTVVLTAKLKFPDISDYIWSQMPLDQQDWMIARFEAGCRDNGAHVQRAKKNWIAKGLLRHTWSSKRNGTLKTAKAPKTAARTGKDIDISRWLESLSEHLQINLSLSLSMVAFLLAPSVSSSSCGVAASSALPETMPGWQPSAVDWSLWIKKEVIEDDLLDLSSPLPPVATVDPALTVLPAVSVSPSAPVLCSAFSPRPMDDDDTDSDSRRRKTMFFSPLPHHYHRKVFRHSHQHHQPKAQSIRERVALIHHPPAKKESIDRLHHLIIVLLMC
ncbi:hypothetical protein [Absidia glauca]|uniref:Uncharacterized protein n=1 Tax=Absidia glauca TaxID=4829 RepID=A0A168LX71_ABSGL|nr:hypothetical protein [Absidia glauca]